MFQTFDPLDKSGQAGLESGARDNPKLAIGAIITACLALSLGDALIKQQSASFVLWQIFILRSTIALPFLIFLVRVRSCDASLLPASPVWTLLRSLILVSMWIFYFTALPHVDLAVAAAAYYTLPIFIILLAAIFLGERMGPRGGAGVLLGFIGVLLILQPQADDFNAYALLPIAAALCYAVAMILTRSKCRGEKPTVLALWLNAAFIVTGAVVMLCLLGWAPVPETVALNPFLFAGWTPMGLDEWRVMAILAGAILVGSIGAAIAYQSGPASTVATFDYTYVAFAVIWGFVLFAELPGAAAAIGIVLIVAGGIIATRQGSA